MTAVPLAPATVRPFAPHDALRDELGLPRDRFGPFTTAFARTRDGRHLVGLVTRHLAVLHASSGEVAWWVPLPPGIAEPPLVLLDGDLTAALMIDRALVGVALGSGAVEFRMEGLTPGVSAVAPCPDDPRSLYVVGPNASVLLVDPHTRDIRWDLRASAPAWGGGSPRALAVSDDGRLLLVVLGDACELWDTHERRRVRRFFWRDEPVAAAAFAPGGRVFLAMRHDRLRVVDVASGDVLAERALDPGLEPTAPARVSPDGARVAFGRGAYTLHEVALDGLTPRRSEKHGDALCDVLPDGDGWLSLWRHGVLVREGSLTAEGGVFLGRAQALAAGGGVVAVQRAHGVDAVRLDAREVSPALADAQVRAISPDGRFAVCHDRRVDLASGASVAGEAGERTAVDDRGRVVSAWRGRVTFWPEGKTVATPVRDPVLDLRLSPNGERAFVLHSKLRMLLVDRDGAVALVKLPAPGPWAPLDEARIAIWDHRAALTVYDAAADEVVLKAKSPKRGAGLALANLAAHPAAGLLVGGGYFGTAVLVELATGTERVRWSAGVGEVVVGFTPDGSRVVTTADDPFVRTWDVAALLATPGPAVKKPKARRAKR